MLLRDCPVGSFVRMDRIGSDNNYRTTNSWWEGEFEVFEEDGNKFIIDRDGTIREHIADNPYFQFEIVTPENIGQPKAIQIDGKSYKLTPRVERKTITIDGVVYEMEEIS